MSFIRYNSTAKYWEYDTSGGLGIGPWLILPISYGSLINTENVAVKNADNQFSVDQTINKSNPIINFNDTAAGANLKKWNIQSFAGDLYFQARADNGAFQVNAIRISRNGGLYERDRTVPMGEWQSYTCTLKSDNGTIYSGSGGGFDARYMLVGKTVFFNIYFGTGTAPPTMPTGTIWAFALPPGFPVAFGVNVGYAGFYANDGRTYTGTCIHGGFFSGALSNCAGVVCNVGNQNTYAPVLSQTTPFNWVANCFAFLAGSYGTT